MTQTAAQYDSSWTMVNRMKDRSGKQRSLLHTMNGTTPFAIVDWNGRQIDGPAEKVTDKKCGLDAAPIVEAVQKVLKRKEQQGE